MEITIFNDILTQTVNKAILGINLDQGMNEAGFDHRGDVGGGGRLSQSSFISRGSDSRDHSLSFDMQGHSQNNSRPGSQDGRVHNSTSNAPSVSNQLHGTGRIIQNCSIPEWLHHNAPIYLKQSLVKLGLELENIEKMNLSNLSADELGERKKKTKNELKYYDTNFENSYGRFPNREEKEPMRPLYIYYKLLKQALDKTGQSNVNPLEKLKEDLADLKAQRNELRTKLENYQNDFIRRNNRRIRYRGDIVEVEADYNLYKRLKEDITALETKIASLER